MSILSHLKKDSSKLLSMLFLNEFVFQDKVKGKKSSILGGMG
jgi:hypothetical protein